MVKIKCPKCKSEDIYYEEMVRDDPIYEFNIVFDCHCRNCDEDWYQEVTYKADCTTNLSKCFTGHELDEYIKQNY